MEREKISVLFHFASGKRVSLKVDADALNNLREASARGKDFYFRDGWINLRNVDYWEVVKQLLDKS